MNENLKNFLEEVGKNKELKAKLEALTDKDTAVEKVIKIAEEYGFTLTVEDFKKKAGEELSDENLASAAGGRDGDLVLNSNNATDDDWWYPWNWKAPYHPVI